MRCQKLRLKWFSSSALVTFPAGPAGAVSAERVAVGAVQARAVVAAVVAPPPRGTR